VTVYGVEGDPSEQKKVDGRTQQVGGRKTPVHVRQRSRSTQRFRLSYHVDFQSIV
jgi:hypothetical protein